MRRFVFTIAIDEGHDEWWEGHPEYIDHLPRLEDVQNAVEQNLGYMDFEILSAHEEDLDGNVKMFPEVLDSHWRIECAEAEKSVNDYVNELYGKYYPSREEAERAGRRIYQILGKNFDSRDKYDMYFQEEMRT